MSQMKKIEVPICGMHCRSCEVLIEQRFKDIEGVQSVSVNATTGTAIVTAREDLDIQSFCRALEGTEYTLDENLASTIKHPGFVEIFGYVGLVLLLGMMLKRIGLFDQGFAFDESTTLGSVVAVGLLAASSSCVAVSGGLMLSVFAKLPDVARRMAPWQFVVGRILSYAFFGGLIGWLGRAVQPSPTVIGAIMVVAAILMFAAGLDLLHLLPKGLKSLIPSMPKSISQKLLNAKGVSRIPFALGAVTFFLPCGFTQALQVYALTTGSPLRSAILLGGFALGTAPALLLVSKAVPKRGDGMTFFRKFSGAVLLVLGVWNVQNGLITSGVPLDVSLNTPKPTQTSADPNVSLENGIQVIRMKLGVDPYYTPADSYTVKAGVPVRMEISGVGTGCRSGFQIPRFGVSTILNKQKNILEFTPDRAGRAVFSCTMGMFPGYLNVVNG